MDAAIRVLERHRFKEAKPASKSSKAEAFFVLSEINSRPIYHHLIFFRYFVAI